MSDSKRMKFDDEEVASLKEEIFKYIDTKFDALQQQLIDLKSQKSSQDIQTPVSKPDTKQSDITTTTTSEKPPLPPRNTSPGPEKAVKHTFGGTSFNFKVTPTNSITEPKTPKDTPGSGPKDTPKDKPVFGSTTSFSERPKVNIFDTGSSFGSNSKFSGAFQNSLKKRSFLDVEPEATQEDKAEEKEEEKENPVQYKQIDLTLVEKQTGEENEQSQFSSLCKLFELEFDKISEGWKERGLGTIHLNQSTEKKLRLVMRSNGLLRVILNVPIFQETEVFKGLESSLSPDKYLRFNSIKDSKPVQYLLKFSNANLRNELFDKIESLKSEL